MKLQLWTWWYWVCWARWSLWAKSVSPEFTFLSVTVGTGPHTCGLPGPRPEAWVTSAALGCSVPRRQLTLLCLRRSHLQGQSVVTVIGGEEHFEDYGEGSETELSPETLCGGDHGCRDPTFLTPR